MGNFEKLSVVVIVVIIVMILVVALHTWTDRPDASSETASEDSVLVPSDGPFSAPPPAITCSGAISGPPGLIVTLSPSSS